MRLGKAGARRIDPSLILRDLKNDPVGSHALTYLDVIDAKVNAIFTFIGVLMAGLIIFIANDADIGQRISLSSSIEFQLKWVVIVSMLKLLVAAIFALSCIHIIDLPSLLSAKRELSDAVISVQRIARSRRWRYLLALRLTALGTITTSIAVLTPLLGR